MEANAEPDPKFIAQQLRKPAGEFAKPIAEKMDFFNGPLFDLTLNSMQLSDQEAILEIGFGSGSYFQKLFQKADRLHVSGIDYSKDMVDEAKNKNQSLIDSNGLSLKMGNSDNLPFSDESFDKVFCNMVIYFWDQPEEHLKEIHRVLKPNGRFYTGIRAKKEMIENFPFTKYGFNLYDQHEWSSILEENGFKLVGTNKKMDPVLELDDQKMQLESICLIARKK